MKKTLALLIAVMMIASLFTLTGCAKKEDLDYIKGKGNLVIGFTYFAPMNYDDDNGEFVGFETEFAKAVCAKLGIEPKFQEINWETKETELNARNIDCIWNGMSITDERLQTMGISTPYMENKQILVVKAENAGKFADAGALKGAKIVAEQGSAGEEVAQSNAFFAESEYTGVSAQSKALMEVFAGTADGAVIDYVMSIGSIGEGTDYADLVTVDSMAFEPEQYGIAFRKGDEKLLAAVNGAITELVNDGTLKTIAEKYKLEDLLIAK